MKERKIEPGILVGLPCSNANPLSSGLDHGIGLLFEIEPPGGRSSVAGVRRHDDEARAIGNVEQRCDPNLPALSPHVGQQQHVHAQKASANSPAARNVDAAVEEGDQS